MNGLVLDSEVLNRALDGRELSREELEEVCGTAGAGEILETSRQLQRRFKGNRVTFSKKAFFNLVNLCADTCSYCTYKAEPGQEKLSMMSRERIAEMLDLARRYRCVEILLVTGERPEKRYREARDWLRANGFGTTAEYLAHASEMALERGMFPHTNAGNLERDEMRDLARTNVSMGLMLENVSGRLSERGMPHHMAASKRPEARLEALENAGRLGIPMTTGVLVGIGETTEEIVDSLFAIRDIHRRHGNIQETILQNFQPKQDTGMGDAPPAGERYFKTVVALARIIMPGMNIQIPPNLSPESYHGFLSTGINDWGGISPLTPDYVNPEFAWPRIGEVERRTRDAGFEFGCRFPVYPEFFSMVSKDLRERMSEIEDRGLVREDYWR